MYSTLGSFAHSAEPHQKKKLHRMLDHVVEKQKELDGFYKHFNK
jgi:hypothetical protein